MHRNGPNNFHEQIATYLQANELSVRSSKLSEAIPMAQEPIIVLAELESSLFCTLTAEELSALQRMTNDTSTIMWVTSGGLQQGLQPEFAMTSGWARVVRGENQHIRFVTIDIDDAPSSKRRLKELLVDIVAKLAITRETYMENEYSIDDGAVYISRLIPDGDINAKYTNAVREPKVAALKDAPALQGESRSGRIIFQCDERVETCLEPHEIEVQVRAIGLDKEAAVAFTGADLSPYLNHQISGVIHRVGSSVPSYLAVNDKVFGFSFDNMATLQRTRYDLVQKICGAEPWERIATLPVALSTAIYALEDLSRVQKGENVVIFDDCGLASLLALQICNNIGVHAIVVASSDDSEGFFRSSGIQSELIVCSGREELSESLEHLTNGRGVDVILCSSSTNFLLIDNCRKVLRPFVRIVLCGKDSSKHLALLSAQNPSIHCFDIRTLYQNRPDVLARYVPKMTI